MSEASRPFDLADSHGFVDGQLDLPRRAAFVRSLADDPDLKRRLGVWRAQNEALRAAFGPVLAEPVPVRLMPTSIGLDRRANPQVGDALGPAPSLLAGTDPSRRSKRSLLIAMALSFLAGSLLAFGLSATGATDHRSVRLASDDVVIAGFGRSLAQRAYEAHETYAVDLNHPVEVGASDRTALVHWIQHRIALPIRIPNLKSQGWDLLGGRVLPGDLGPAAYLLYSDGVERLGLYLSRTNSQSADVAYYDNGAGLASVAFWTDEPIGYALTTSRDRAWLERSAPAVIRSIRTQARDTDSAN